MGTLAKRTVFGLLFTAVVVGGLLTPWGLLALVSLLSVFLCYEFYHLTVERRFLKEAVCVALASLAGLVLLFFHFQAGLPLRYVGLAFLPVAAAHVFLLFDAAKDHAFPAAHQSSILSRFSRPVKRSTSLISFLCLAFNSFLHHLDHFLSGFFNGQ